MIIALILIVVVWIANIVGIFIVPEFYMNVGCTAAIIVLAIPIALAKFFKREDPWLKYVFIGAIILTIAIFNVLLNYHVIVAFVSPILLSCMFFDKKLCNKTIWITLVVITIAQVLSYNFRDAYMLNIKSMKDMIIFFILPRNLQVFALGKIMVLICERVQEILNNLMGAEEHGKGFAVVAEEIQNLSDLTRQSVENIGRIIEEVVSNTNDAIKSMEDSVRNTREGLDNINQMETASNNVYNYNGKMIDEISRIYEIEKIIKKNSKEVEKHIHNIKLSIDENYESLADMSKSVEESSSSTETLLGMVDRIKNMSNELNSVVNE